MAHLMAQEGFSSNKVPTFDGTTYAFWKLRMKAYLMALGFEVWQSIVDGYKILESPQRN